ncbi:hypothetical protein QQ045_005961 [Rhodiola kirilowii]
MPPKKSSISEVVEATNKTRNMKLRSLSARRPDKIHTPEPAVKKGASSKQAKKPPVKPTTLMKKAIPKLATTLKNKSTNVVGTAPVQDGKVNDAMVTPKKKTRSVQTTLRRSLRCSSKLRV